MKTYAASEQLAGMILARMASCPVGRAGGEWKREKLADTIYETYQSGYRDGFEQGRSAARYEQEQASAAS